MQTESLHFENQLGQVVHHPTGYVRLAWEPLPMSGPPFRELFGHVQRLWADTGLRRLYSDHRGMPPVWAADCAWLTDEWLPQLTQALPGGRLALVSHDDAVHNAVARLAQLRAQRPGLLVASFEAEETALHWLQAG